MSLRDYHYRRLDDMQNGAYTFLKSALIAHKKRIVIDFIPNIHQALSALKHDCAAELYYVNWTGIENRVSFISSRCKIAFTPSYLFTSTQIAEYNKQIDKLVREFIKCKGESNLCRKVHDWLSMKVRYDSDEVDKHKYRRNNHNIIGALIERKAVCEGIALAFQYILNRLGVDCMTVSGRVMKSEKNYYKDYHAWNVVSLNNENYHVDVTWDHPIEINRKKYPTYGYYCMPTRLFQDHIFGLNIKCSSLEENLFYKAKRLFTSAKELKAFISKRNPYNCCIVYISNLLQDTIDRIIKKNSMYNYKVVRTTQWSQSGMYILFK